ncbi:SCO family protein [Pikeienuella piscinae]|uniref:SCO family protein n=1 Tax=Pikeienuella piscinae TaxID=2748098 RepID=A0A7L5C4S1_9RHOB|nr:SCO family protein [Pikeienuella piscinae]QIE56939.1 SCO family protein [Pikeienuella piscinae]
MRFSAGRRGWRASWTAGAATVVMAAAAFAHDGVTHEDKEEALRHLSDRPLEGDATPFPVDLGGAFTLTDQNGAKRTEADPEGRMQLFFFGYSHCQAICSTALPRMAEIAEIAGAAGLPVRPVLITVDPARDTPEGMTESLAEFGPGIVGLTGTEAELERVRALFQIEAKEVFVDPEYGPVFAHGSFIYLMDGAGALLTVIPPIISPARGAEIVARYAAPGE